MDLSTRHSSGLSWTVQHATGALVHGMFPQAVFWMGGASLSSWYDPLVQHRGETQCEEDQSRVAQDGVVEFASSRGVFKTLGLYVLEGSCG